MKLPESKSNTPHVSYAVEGNSKITTAATTKKTEPTRPSSAAKTASHTVAAEQTKTASREPAKKTSTAAASKKKGPALGTDDHLALYMYDYVKKRGGEVRLTTLRKEAFSDYYDRYPHLRYCGYRYLRKSFIVDYSDYFEVYTEDKIVYGRALEDEPGMSYLDCTPTLDSKKTSKHGGKESVTLSKKAPPEAGQKVSSATDAGSQKSEKKKPAEKVQVVTLRSTHKQDNGKPSEQTANVPSSLRHSQEPVAVSEEEKPSTTVPSSHNNLSQPRTATGNTPASTTKTLETAPPPEKTPQPVVARATPAYATPVAVPRAVATATTTSHNPPVTAQREPSVQSHRPPPPASAHPQPVAQAQGAENEEEWHNSEESWLSEEEFDSPPGTPDHVAKYLYKHMSSSNQSFPFGCTVSELDKHYQSEYRRQFRSRLRPTFCGLTRSCLK